MSAVLGTPTPVFLSAQRWKWEHVSGPHAIEVPFMGNVEGLNVAAVEYDVADDLDVHISFGVIIKTLFTKKLYPSLKEDQVFSISDFLLDRSSQTLTIVGNVIKKVPF